MITLTEQDAITSQDIVDFIREKKACAVQEILPYDTESNQNSPTLSFPSLEIRLNEQTVSRDGVVIPLGHYEFFTLYYLARHPGWVFTREQIYEAVWRELGETGEAVVTNVISQLRHKLWPENPKDGYIRTVRHSGYKFEVKNPTEQSVR
jgi:DNA-binding response OmpR family regulator